MSRETYLGWNLLVGLAAVALAAWFLVGPLTIFAVDLEIGGDRFRTETAATVLVLALTTLGVLARLRAVETERPLGAGANWTVFVPIVWAAYGRGYPLMPDWALWVAAWACGLLFAATALYWIATIARLSRA